MQNVISIHTHTVST